MSRATNQLLDSLTSNDRSIVDSLPIAGKLLLLQWLAASFAIDISDLGSRLAPLSQAPSYGDYLYGAGPTDPTEPANALVQRVEHRFRRGVNIPPETPVEDNGVG